MRSQKQNQGEKSCVGKQGSDAQVHSDPVSF